MNHTEAVEQMLKNLDDWRHLPKYQLERRADLFFGLFIRKIMEERFGKMHDLVLPEFPYNHNEANKTTVNFDYLLFSKDLSEVYVVELKTEPDSAGKDNNSYLEAVLKTNFKSIVEGLNGVIKNTQKKQKYTYLIDKLASDEVKFVEWNTEERKQFKWCHPECIPKLHVLYLSPSLNKPLFAGAEQILFREAAEILEKTGGAVECHFATYLRRWNDVKAGSICNE